MHSSSHARIEGAIILFLVYLGPSTKHFVASMRTKEEQQFGIGHLIYIYAMHNTSY